LRITSRKRPVNGSPAREYPICGWLKREDMMTTPPMVPAGWYADPAGRHEYRFWDGMNWTVHVSDGGIMATAATVPTAVVAAPTGVVAAPTGARRGRPRWAIPVAALAAVVALVIALVIWAPWRSPPLLRPAGLKAGPASTSSVAFRWASPATGPLPDKYL